MTRKDYELIAKELKLYLDRISVQDAEGYRMAIEAVAQALYVDNSRFDEDRFINAILGE